MDTYFENCPMPKRTNNTNIENCLLKAVLLQRAKNTGYLLRELPANNSPFCSGQTILDTYLENCLLTMDKEITILDAYLENCLLT